MGKGGKAAAIGIVATASLCAIGADAAQPAKKAAPAAARPAPAAAQQVT
jgi:hypothetical protein